MTTEPYASASRVFWITGNGPSHRGAAAAERMASTWPNAQPIHLPAHASWLDQAVRHEVACDGWNSSKEDRLMLMSVT